MSKIEWKSLSIEAIVTFALKELGAVGVEKLARTSEVLDTLILMGCTIGENDLRQRLVAEAMAREAANRKMEDETPYIWCGSRWIGGPHDKQWDRHGWCLPLWKGPGD